MGLKSLCMKVLLPNSKDIQKSSNPIKPKFLPMMVATIAAFIAMIATIMMVVGPQIPSFQKDYQVFTLNTSMIGEEINQKIDGQIASIDLEALHIDLVKREVPVVVATLTAAPTTTLVTMAPSQLLSRRDGLDDLVGKGQSSLDELKGKGESALSSGRSRVSSVQSSVASEASSAANSVESGVNGKIDELTEEVKSKLKKFVDQTFDKLREELELQDFYSLHLRGTCDGYYMKDGRNLSANTLDGNFPEKVEKHFEGCHSHSAINPLKPIWGLYILGTVVVGLTFLSTATLTLHGIFKDDGLSLIWKLTPWFSLGSGLLLGLCSLLTHGIASGAEKLVSFLGDDIGVEGHAGDKFLALTWTTTALVFLNALLLFGVRFYEKHH